MSAGIRGGGTLGHLIAAATPAVSLAFTRDSLGRPVSETLTIDPGVLPGFGSRTLTRVFDPGGRPVLLTLPNGDLLQRAFTPADQLAGLTLAGQPLWQADHAGTRLLQAQPGPLHLHHPTDPAGIPQGHTATVADVPRHHHADAWTADRLRETIARHDLRRTLTRLHYDQARRLASLAEQDADLSGLLASPVLRSREEWDLSPEDTLPQRRRIEHGHHHPIHAVTNQLHQVTTLTHPARGTAHYHWTPDGALASRTGPDGQLLLTHDWRDRLIRAQLPDGRTIDYLLDPLGRLTARLRSDGHATVYLSDGDQVVEEYAVPPGGTTPLLQRRLLWGRWIDDLLAVIRDTDGDGVPDSTLYPLTDLLGSVEVLADASGAIVEGVRSRPDGTPEAFAPALPAPAELAWTGDGETSAGHLPPNQLTLTFTAPLGEDLSRLAVEVDGVPHGGTAALSPHGRTLVLSDLTLPATTTLRLGGLADRAGRALPPVEASVTLTDPQRYTVLATWEEPKVQAVLESQAGVTVVATVPVTGDELQGTITVTLNGQPLSGTVSRVAPEALHWSASDEAWQTGAEVTVSLNGLTDLSEPARTVTAGPWSFTVLAAPEAMLVAEDGGAVESRTASAFGVTAYFQGRMWDSDLGMYHYRARWYDPELVNFIQRDPLGYVDSSNLYQALGYNPWNWIDPWGTVKIQRDYGEAEGVRYLRGLAVYPIDGKDVFAHSILSALPVIGAGAARATAQARGITNFPHLDSVMTNDEALGLVIPAAAGKAASRMIRRRVVRLPLRFIKVADAATQAGVGATLGWLGSLSEPEIDRVFVRVVGTYFSSDVVRVFSDSKGVPFAVLRPHDWYSQDPRLVENEAKRLEEQLHILHEVFRSTLPRFLAAVARAERDAEAGRSHRIIPERNLSKIWEIRTDRGSELRAIYETMRRWYPNSGYQNLEKWIVD